MSRSDPFTAWNTAAWTDGVFIHVPEIHVVNKPVLIYNLHDARDGQVISASRNLFVVGKNSEVTIVEKFDSLGEHCPFFEFSNGSGCRSPTQVLNFTLYKTITVTVTSKD